MNQLKSSLDNHGFEPEILRNSDCLSSTASATLDVVSPTIVCKTPSKATKMKDLSSNILGSASSTHKF